MEKLEIRDLRKQDWVWTSKTLLFHPQVDGNMYKIYGGLASFADNRSQEAFPSIETLAKRLHMGRNTVIRGLQKLETLAIIEVKKELGAHNIYTLLDISTDEKPKQETPASITRDFFKGVADIRDKKESAEGTTVKGILASILAKYPTVEKKIFWAEIQIFERYWTEKNKMGTKLRWEMQETFEVDRRLSTWFSKKKEFTKVTPAPVGKRMV